MTVYIKTRSPGHGRDVLAGAVVGKTFHKQVAAKHYFRNWDCYAIQEELFQTLVRGGIEQVIVEVIQEDELSPPIGRYISDVKDWLEPRIKVAEWGGYGKQRFFPFKKMRKL